MVVAPPHSSPQVDPGLSTPIESEDVNLLIAQRNLHAAGSSSFETLDRLFEQQAERTPDGIAVQLGCDRLTYRELGRRSNQLAHFLRGYELQPDSLVAICLDRSLEMIVSMLA